MKKRNRILLTAAVAGIIGLVLKAAGPYLLVANAIPGRIPLTAEDRYTLLNGTVERIEPVRESIRDQVFREFADQPTDALILNERSGVVHASRTILANFMLDRDVDRWNQLLQKIEVFGNAGSSWARNRNADYDFALIWMIAILYEFGDDEAILHPASRDYLLNILLTEEGRLNRMVPRTGGLVFDTENHLLMREGSRYLKNQWLKAQGPVPARLDNDRNGLGEWLEEYLNHIRLKGVYEYNSTPYVVYTLLPLMNLADYAESETIKRLAKSIADNIALRYSYGSYKLRQCAPFRRQLKHAENPSLRLNRFGRFVQFQLDPAAHHNDTLVYASVLHGHTLPTETYERFAEPAKEEYYAIFAHEQKGSPEIYSGGPNYLLSAGGAYRGAGAKVISRPIALLLDDTGDVLDDCIHIRGKGSWKQWNMTGVHRRFAVARGSVFIPESLGHSAVPGWNVLKPNDDITVAFYQGGGLAMLAVLPDTEMPLSDVQRMLEASNPMPEQVNQFHWPAAFAPEGIEVIAFNPDAGPETWVISSVNGEAPAPMTTHALDNWPPVHID